MPQIHVFDTFATTSTGRIKHFDVVIPEKDNAKALRFAREWLRALGEDYARVAPESCAYCHSEHSEAGIPPAMERAIAEKGYAICKLEGCP